MAEPTSNDSSDQAQPGSPLVINIGQVTVNLLARQVTRDGLPVHLPALEFDLLAYLARQAGRAVPYAELWREVWHCQPTGRSNDAIKSCVKRLREAIEPDPHNPRYVLAVRNYGYMMPTDVDTPPSNNPASKV
jgi:two-component system KDP operon response regulator KdpE